MPRTTRSRRPTSPKSVLTHLLPALAGSGCGSARVLVVPRPRKKQSPAYTLRRSVRFGSSASVRLVVSPALLVAGVRAHVERLRGRHRPRGALELADGVLVHRAHELDAGLDVFEPWGASTGTVGEGKEEGDEEENRQNRVPHHIITWKKETSAVSHLRRRCRRSAARPSASRRVRRGTRSPPRARASWPSPARRRSLGCRTA